jgi:hypothetical protein
MECTICFNLFNDQAYKPLFLVCGHTFCRECITGLNRDGLVVCPICNLQIKVESVDRLSVNYSLLSMQAAGIVQPEMSNKDDGCLMCPQHPSKKAKFFCDNCLSPICSACFIGHKAHEVLELEAYISKSLDTVYRRGSEIEHCLTTRQTELVAISDRANQSYSASINELEAAYQALLEEVGKEYQSTMQTLRTQSERTRVIFETMLKLTQENLVKASEATRSALEIRHSYSKPAEHMEQLRHLKQFVSSVVEGPEQLDYALCTLQADRQHSYLGRLDIDVLSFNLAAFPREQVLETPQRPEDSVLSSSSIEPGYGRFSEALPEGRDRHSLADSNISVPVHRGRRGGRVAVIRRRRDDEVQPPPQPEEGKQISAFPSGSQARWSYLTNSNNYKAYNAEDNRAIEQAYQQGLATVDVRQYVVDLRQMQQVNRRSHKARGIIRHQA